MGKNRLAPKEKDRLKEKIIQSDKDFFKGMGKNRLASKKKDRLKEKIIQSDRDFFKSISLEARNQLALMNEQLKKVYSSNDKTKIFVENKIAKVLKEFDAMEYKGYACKGELQKLTKQVETIKKDIVKNAGKEIEAVKKLIPSINLNDYYTRAEVDEKIMKQTFIVGGGGAGDQGPQGDKGDKGDKGDTGDTGPAGTTTRAGITDKPLETLLYGNANYTYTDGLVSLITYPQGTIALSYTDGLVTTATYTVGTDIYTITYTYTDGQITSITYT